MRGRKRAALAIFAALAALVAYAVPSAPAADGDPELAIFAGPGKLGAIDLLLIGPAGTRIQLYEEIRGERVPLRRIMLNDQFAQDGTLFAQRIFQNIGRWRCDRRTRRFVATAIAGPRLTAVGDARTPSCHDRVILTASKRVRVGGRARIKIADRWRYGGLRPNLCFYNPRKGRRCKRMKLPNRSVVARTRSHRLTKKGYWRVEIRIGGARIRREIAVGVRPRRARVNRNLPRVLVAGDSLMAQLQGALDDKLAGKARIESDVRGGSGLLDPEFNLLGRARRRASLEAAVAIIMVGGADGRAIETASGQRIACCSKEWSLEYAQRAHQLMTAYARGGATKVIWVNPPAARRAAQRAVIAATNLAGLYATPHVPGAQVVELSPVFTPGFVFRDSLIIRDRPVRVRQEDGIHFTVAGAKLAADLVLPAIGTLPRPARNTR